MFSFLWVCSVVLVIFVGMQIAAALNLVLIDARDSRCGGNSPWILISKGRECSTRLFEEGILPVDVEALASQIDEAQKFVLRGVFRGRYYE